MPPSNATPTLIGYARVSTAEQDPSLQRDALKKAGCERIFEDAGVSGSLASRPELDAMLAHLRPGDIVVTWRLDRLGRSLAHLLALVEDLEQRGVGLRSLTEQLDTSTTAGRLIFQIFGALAEFERQLIRERTAAGLVAARARGRRGGRPTVMTPAKLMIARQLLSGADRRPVVEVAETLGVGVATLYRALSREQEQEQSAKAQGGAA